MSILKNKQADHPGAWLGLSLPEGGCIDRAHSEPVPDASRADDSAAVCGAWSALLHEVCSADVSEGDIVAVCEAVEAL